MAPPLYPVRLLVEGPIDEVVVRRILDHLGLSCGPVYGKRGKDYIIERLPKYNQAAYYWPWLVVVDLDQQPECAPLLVQEALPHPAPGMCFRIAVHAIESWLLADANRLAAFLSVPLTRIPIGPDTIPDPKRFLVDLARRSHRKAIRDDMIPREGSSAQVGPGYAGRLVEFVTTAADPWRPEVAREHSPSLTSCVEALKTLKAWKLA